MDCVGVRFDEPSQCVTRHCVLAAGRRQDRFKNTDATVREWTKLAIIVDAVPNDLLNKQLVEDAVGNKHHIVDILCANQSS
mmetsp:Transcript_52109/g.113247  ORF Transcript_52109/g.113247 Transcript_52109/m.113247 type:complete len:81 (-) Transcript_52109:129-371(-)